MAIFDGAIFDSAIFDVGEAFVPISLLDDGGYGRRAEIEAEERLARRRKDDADLDRLIEWSFDPTQPRYPEDVLAGEDEPIDTLAPTLAQMREAVLRRRDEEDAIAALLMVM